MTLSSQEGHFHNVKKIKRNKSSSSFLAFTSQDRVSLALFFMPFWCVLALFHCFQIICSYLHFWKGIQYLFIVCTFHYFIQWVYFYLEFFPFWSLFLNSTTQSTDLQDYTKKRVPVLILGKLCLWMVCCHLHYNFHLLPVAWSYV